MAVPKPKVYAGLAACGVQLQELIGVGPLGARVRGARGELEHVPVGVAREAGLLLVEVTVEDDAAAATNLLLLDDALVLLV